MAGSGSRLTGISWCKNGLDGRGRTDGYCVKGDDMPYYWLIGGGSRKRHIRFHRPDGACAEGIPGRLVPLFHIHPPPRESGVRTGRTGSGHRAELPRCCLGTGEPGAARGTDRVLWRDCLLAMSDARIFCCGTGHRPAFPAIPAPAGRPMCRKGPAVFELVYGTLIGQPHFALGGCDRRTRGLVR